MNRDDFFKKNPLGKVIAYVMDDFIETDFFGISAQMAFYLLLSFFPLLIFLVHFVGRFVLSFETYLDQLLATYLPKIAYDYVISYLDIIDSYSTGNPYFLLLIAFFFASLAARAIMTGMNSNYGLEPTIGRLQFWLRSMLYTLLFAISIILILLAYIVSEYLLGWVLTRLGVAAALIGAGDFFTPIAIFFVSILLFWAVYTLGPEKHLGYRGTLPGAAFASLGINVGFRIFLGFMDNSIRYALLYGNYSGLFALLVVIYYICLIINLGAKINIYWARWSTRRSETS